MAAIDIKSFNQILGGMVRKIVAETPLSDVNPGSVFLSLLEACASNDFENNVAILNVLELLSVDNIRNSDLDNKAADLGLVRKPATAASGVVSIFNTNITKQSSSLYSLKPAPIAGQTVLFVTNTSGWASSGSLYIGRGTSSFEGPVPYTSITTFSTYSQINLGSALQKDHLASDMVVNAQGQADRVIPAGTTVKIPANNQNAEVLYNTLRDAIIPAGEDKVDNVLVVAAVPGTQGNALINTIKRFDSVPFTGATVSNTQAFTSGTDVETDVQLRNRIKSYCASLARGTSPSILNAVIGLSDPDENKRVVSAVLTHPVALGNPSILYVDDGSGFQPSFTGQAVDTLLSSANGTEEFLQLANYPLPRPQVVNSAVGPFLMIDQMFLRVAVDGIEETIVFTVNDFVNITVATASEIIAAINARATLFRARLTKDSKFILLYPVNPDAETIQVIAIRSSDNTTRFANNVLAFPTDENSYIALYQNSTRLRQQAKKATVETVPFAAWNLLTPGDLILSVDGTPAQDGSFSLADFPGVASFTLLTLQNWVDALNAKFAGITATATPGQTMRISSNKDGSAASIKVIGGTYRAPMFSTNASSSTGQASQFEINRQTGNIRLRQAVAPGDTVSAGVSDAKGYIITAPSVNGVFALDDDASGRQTQFVVVTDAASCKRVSLRLQVGDTFTVSDQTNNVMRIMASTTAAFQSVQPGHYIFITAKTSGGWFNATNVGLFKVIAKGSNTSAGVNSYIHVHNSAITAEAVTVSQVDDITAFATDGYPQIWRGSSLSSPATTTLSQLIASIQTGLRGVRASVFRSTALKLTSTTEKNGSIAIPVSVGKASAVFGTTAVEQKNNAPLVANKVAKKDMVGFAKPAPIVSGNTYLSRSAYPLVQGALTLASIKDNPPFAGTYSETIESTGLLTSAKVDYSDIVLFTRGDNKSQLRSIAAKPAANSVATQPGLPRTLFDHQVGDEVTLFQGLQLGADDNAVFVMDNDASVKTVDIAMARSAQVNSGSAGGSFVPNTTDFSANDTDNEVGTDFGTVGVWGTSLNGTDFSDYTILMRARNWYASGGTASGNGKFIIRSTEYGTNGTKMRFSIKYPTLPSQTKKTLLVEGASYSLLSYYFGSSTDRATAISAGTTVTITGPYSTAAINFPAGASTGGGGLYWDLSFGTGDFSSVLVGDVLSILPGSGLLTTMEGQYSVQAKSGSVIRIFNPNIVAPATPTLATPSLVHIFPITDTTVNDVVTTVNASNSLVAAAIGSTSAAITKSTQEDRYTYVSNATALAYSHNPDVAANRDTVSLWDGINWIKAFDNANPNFVVKVPFTLTSSGVSSSIYAMHTTVNEDSSVGERFKLVPTTIKNIKHHLTQKALSQLPILSDVSVATSGKRVQVVTKQLGSKGGIQVVGGGANLAQTKLIGDSQVVSDSAGSYLLARVGAFPNAYSINHTVKIQNPAGVARQSQLLSTDTVSVSASGSGTADYLWNAKTTNFTAATTITITDVSSSYLDYTGTPLASGMVFRWTHSVAGSESLANVAVGNIVAARNISGWSQTNLAKVAGDGHVAGLPIVAVNDASHYFDVLCPYGKTMASTAIGSGTITIHPTPQIRWNLAHMSRIGVDSLSRNSNVMTVTCSSEHFLNTGDSVALTDSNVLADGTYGTVTVTSPIAFTFSNAGSNVSETNVGASIINSLLSPTKYRLEVLGVNDMVKLSWASGEQPRFADAGVAVDDYIVISGTSFDSLNNGTYRVIAVDNKSVTFENPNAVENTRTLVRFNNMSLSTSWTANSTVVTGSAGAFKNLTTGVWVKKEEDGDDLYVQVTGNNTGSYATATQITLGAAYAGITGTSFGISYDQSTANAGVVLKRMDDVAFYDGDATLNDDTLSVQNIANASWFSSENIGNFNIIMTGSNPSDYRPFVRVTNSRAKTETNRAISVSPQGFYIIESNANKFYSYRRIYNSTVNATNSTLRSLYMLPDSRSYKFAEANNSFITHMGKLNFDLGPSIGTDGYLFYTGLMRRVQRTIDGFNADQTNFPERRAIGSRIETLPPLIKNLSLVLTITTDEGTTIQDVGNNVKSAIIDHVRSLGVGQDVILSSIIAKVMQVRGVAAATFNVPAAIQERIGVAPNERAVIAAENIGIN